jgi:hypothetical protein
MGQQIFSSNAGRLKTLVKDLAALDTAGGVISIANPEGVEILITEVLLIVSTKSTGACTVNFGVAANGTTSSDTIIDGVDVGAAAGRFDNINDKGGNGGRDRALASTEFITGSMATGAAAGLAGQLVVNYVV